MQEQEFMELYKDTQKRTFAVYRELAGRAAVKRVEAEALQKKLESGRYSISECSALMARKSEIERELRDITPEASDRVDAIFSEAAEAVKAGEILNPADIDAPTMAILNSGVTLSGEDYAPLLERFADNATMRRVILDHAEKHGVELSGREIAPLFAAGMGTWLQALNNLRENVRYTEKWLVEDNADEMISTFEEIAAGGLAHDGAMSR